MVSLRLLLLRWKIELHERLETIWENRWFGIAITSAFTICAGYFLLAVPPPGVSVAVLGVAAALMAGRTKATGAEKAAWMLIISTLLVIEVLAIRKDRREHDENDKSARLVEQRNFSMVLQALGDLRSTNEAFALVNQDVKQVKAERGSQSASLAGTPVTDKSVKSDLRTRALTLSRDILQFLSERQRNSPLLQQVPNEITSSESLAASTPTYMRDTLAQFTLKFEPAVISIHDELASWGLKDNMFDATYQNVGHMFGNTDGYIRKVADAIRKLALWLPPVGLYEEVPDAKLAEMAFGEAKHMEDLANESLSKRTAENRDATMFSFQTHFRECCLDNVRNLRGVIVRRLGPQSFSEAEMRKFADLMETESFPGKQDASIASALDYAPELRALGEKLMGKARQ
jgi:hypothetical protein